MQKVGGSAGVETLLPTLCVVSCRLVLDRSALLTSECQKWFVHQQRGVAASSSSGATG
jgi:hypothetical protein